MDTIEKKMTLKKRFLAFIASMAVIAGGVVAGVQADTTETGKVQVDVVDANRTPLAGAKLQIVDANGGVRADFESNGQTQEFTLEAGNYSFHELVAPEGYEVAEDVPFEVVASQTVHTEIQQNAPPVEDDNTAVENNNTKNETRSAPAPKAQGTLSAVCVNGKDGNDDNDGSKESPVKTWDKAKELLASNGTIYIAGTLDVSGDISTDNPAQQVVTRAPGFTSGNMFNVTDSANFTNIHIKGNGETVGNSVIAFEHKHGGKSLVVGQGVTIENFVSTGEGAAVYVSDAAGASVTFDGAKFLNNQAINGGAVAIRTAKGSANANGFTVNITGGTVFDGNVAKHTDNATGQGGAIFLNGQFVTNINNATFKNNKAQYGAAIVNYNEYIGNEINIVNGLVTGNTTGSGRPSHGALGRSGLSAGGVNICMSGAAEVNISSQNGVAIFDNNGPKGDIAVWDNSDPSKLKVNEGAMLGGGNHNWQPVGARGYKSAPSAADKAAARASATVVFENNTSDYHGTIMSNSLVQFGKKLAELRIKKIDAVTQKAMAGVVFKLTSENGISRTSETFVEPSDEGHNAAYQDNHDGVASFTDLPDGTYTLTEVTPDGYRGTMPWTVNIVDSQVTIKDNGQGLVQPVEGKYYNFVVRNQPMTVKISKQALGDDTKELPGAEIVVKDAKGNEVAHWTSTDKPKEFAVKPGEYTLTEVNAPEGFDTITTTVKFTVDEYGKVTVTNATEFDDGEVRVKDINHLVLTDFPKPEVTTDAKDAADGDKYVEATGTARVTDVVTYKNLKPGKEYTITGTLHKKVNGKDADVIATKTEKFTPKEANGTIELTFEFDASKLAGATLVAFESVKRDGVEVASHADIEDGAQTVRVVKIGTSATGEDGKAVFADSKLKITDTVSYKGLEGGKTYTLKGTLVKKSDGSPVATGEAKFVAAASGEGTATVEFNFDASDLAGESVVAYEYLFEGDFIGKNVNETSNPKEFVTKHEDLNDEKQTVEIVNPEVTTSASDKDDKDKVLSPEEEVTVVDEVTYTGLIPGKKYKVSGVLMDKATNQPLVVNGTQVTAEKTFTADKANGSIKLEFTFDASALNNKKLVVFETVTYGGKEVATHTDIEDTAQTVEITEKPTIGTFAKDGADGDREIENAKDQTIVDTVKYSNLNTNRTYRVVGVLMDKATGNPVLVNGKQVTAKSEDFKPDTADGEVTVTFTVDGRQVAGKDLVVFEKLYLVKAGAIDESKPVVTHEDITDTEQTVHVKDTPEIEKYVNKNVHQEIDLSEVFTYDVLAYVTKDADKVVITDTLNDDLQFVSAADAVAVVDLGAENNHKPGAEGTVSKDGTPVANAVVAINGQTLSVTIEPAKDYRGHWVKVTFDAKIKDGKTIDDLKYVKVKKNTPVLTDEQHEGVPNDASYTIETNNGGTYEDESNTVTVKPAEIGTIANGLVNGEGTGKVVFNGDKVTIDDIVTYKGLEAGETYTLKGKLVKKSDSSVIATGQTTFKAIEGVQGFVVVEFTVDASKLAGDSVVAFEYLYHGDVTEKDVNEQSEEYVTKHEDIDDADQTVKVIKPEVGTTATDKVDGDHLVGVGQATIVDRVEYKNLIPGKKYTVTGTLHVKNADGTDGGPLETEGATATKEFTADEANGHVDLEFTIDTSALIGKKLVAFEVVKYAGVTVGVHEDITDEAQTVEVEEPKVTTDAADAADGDKYLDIADDVVINDVVTFTGLIPGQEYTLDGTLHVKDAKQTPVKAKSVKAVAAEGATIKDAEARTFVAYKANGTVTLAFTVDGTQVAGEQVVVFESLKYLGKEIAAHADINDTNQTVYFPEVGTVATTTCDEPTEFGEGNESTDSECNKVITIRYTESKTVTITDTIKYSGLTSGATYTVKGQLVAKNEEQTVMAENAGVFQASETGAGEWTLDFTFEANRQVLDGIAELVVFEYVFDGDVTAKDIDLSKADEDKAFVAKHEDINDESQTIRIRVTYPTPVLVGTTATDAADGNKALEAGSAVKVKDVVEFGGLTIGRTYTLKAKLVVKGTGGKTVVAEAEKSFTPDVEDGTTDMFFEFNTTGLEGKELVAYEYLLEGDMVGQDVDLDSLPDDLKHADDNDAAQTVVVKKPVEPKTPPTTPRVKLPITGLPRTGSSIAAAFMAALLLIGGGMVLVRRREER